MFTKIYQMLFMMTLAAGTIIAISSSNWLTCWLGLEINLISITPLMLNKLSPQSTEAAIKYFLAQAMASLILIYASVSMSVSALSNFTEINNIAILMALALKTGMPPLHFWFPQVMKSSNWNLAIIILTWQKVAPLVLMSYLNFSMIIFVMILISCLVGPLGGLNQMNMKFIMTYSSITHSGWMVATIFYNFNMWAMYFMVYSLISISLVTMISDTHLESLKKNSVSHISNINKIMVVMTMMSLGGLPPMLGFIPKLMVTQTLMSSKMELIALFLIAASLVSLFYYMRVTYSFMFINQPVNNFIKSFNKKMALMKTTMAITILGNVLVPMSVFLV